jgi:drug/metabolite transporter (DMT)-like permease
MGELLALGSALCFSISNVTVNRGVRPGAADNGAFLSLLLTTVISGACWLGLGAVHGFAPVTGAGLLWLAGAGVLTGFVGRVFLYESIQRLGAVRASAVKRLNPLFALLLGVLVLGEAVSGWSLAGVLLVLASFALLVHAQLRQRKPGGTGGSAMQRLLNLGYLYGPVSALGYALGYLLRKCGLREAPDPFLGAMVGTLVAAFVFVLAGRFNTGYRAAVAATFRAPNAWLFAAGVAGSLGQILYFAALNVSPMSRVALITSLEVFLTMGLSLLVLGERLPPRVAAAAAIGFAGAALLAWP